MTHILAQRLTEHNARVRCIRTRWLDERCDTRDQITISTEPSVSELEGVGGVEDIGAGALQRKGRVGVARAAGRADGADVCADPARGKRAATRAGRHEEIHRA